MAILITTFYQDSSPERQEELNFALQSNLNNKFIDRVVLFVERSFPTASISHPKVVFSYCAAKIPSYGEFLAYATTLPDDSIVVIANSDICFDHEIQKIRTWNLHQRLVALSRKEGRPENMAVLVEHHFSSDTWILKTPVLPSSTDDIFLGVLHCETAFICKMQQAGYQISNASLSISSFHIHESGKRNYTQQNSPYDNIRAQAFPLISGAYASGLISQREKEAPLLFSTAALIGNKIVPHRIWKELLPLLLQYLPPGSVLLTHNAELTSYLEFPLVEGPTINPSLSFQETSLLDNICTEFGSRLFFCTSGSIPATIPSIAPIYDIKYELTHTQSNFFIPEVFAHRFAPSNFFFDQTIMVQSRELFDPLTLKKYCLLPKGKTESFSSPDNDPTLLSDLGITRKFFLLVGDRFDYSGRSNAESLFQALCHNDLHRNFQIVSIGGQVYLEKELSKYPSARDAVLLSPSDSILKKLYSLAFAHISTARIKGVELSNIEAMQCKCPVVIVQYDNPFRDYWKNCIITPTLDGESLQEIVTLLEDTNTRNSVAQAGIDYTNTLSWENAAKKLGMFIRELFTAPPGL